MNVWEGAYSSRPPWDIGKPQPAIVNLYTSGQITTGKVLDTGCGTGENAIFLAQNGLTITGIDVSENAIRIAKEKAEKRKVKVNFQVHDALKLSAINEQFDSVIDCGLFHTFSDEGREIFRDQLKTALKKGGTYFMLCFSDEEPTNWGGPRRVSKQEIQQTFSAGFKVNYIQKTLFESLLHRNGGKAYLSSLTRI